MPETIRDEAALLALYADNEDNEIDAPDLRDFVVSVPTLAHAAAADSEDAHAVATPGGDGPGTAGFMSAADKSKLDLIEDLAQANEFIGLEAKTVSAATYTLLDADYDKRLIFTNAAGCDVTVETGLTAGRSFEMFSTLAAISILEGAGMSVTANSTFVDPPASAGALSPLSIIVQSSAVAFAFGDMAVA